ncbi:MAG: NAD(+) diphosphatase [Treponema sp.]|nr:NAD(+) diphosphatase [Treponema sp.]
MCDVDPGRIFLFQGSAMILPPGDWEDHFRGLGRELLEASFADARSDLDIFEIPALNSSAAIFAASVPVSQPLPSGWQAVPVRHVLSALCGEKTQYSGSGLSGCMLRAYHAAQWRMDSRFCGCCGEKNTDAPDEFARLCPVCGRREYPRISPAVITIIINDRDEALLAHNKKFSQGMYSLIAGFNEAGESLEDTVTREILEEVGIEVRDIRYITSQPWPFPNSLMLGFTCRHAGGSIRPDGIEIEDARWFNRDNLPPLPGYGSVSRYLIELWQKGNL